MRKLGELQRRVGRPGRDLSLDDMDEKKKVFDETVERVQKQFFGYQKENACAGNEEVSRPISEFNSTLSTQPGFRKS